MPIEAAPACICCGLQPATCVNNITISLCSLLAASHRDLISSADTIIDIAKSCDHLVSLVGDIQAGIGGLAGGLRERKTSTSEGEANTSYDRLYGERVGNGTRVELSDKKEGHTQVRAV